MHRYGAYSLQRRRAGVPGGVGVHGYSVGWPVAIVAMLPREHLPVDSLTARYIRDKS